MTDHLHPLQGDDRRRGTACIRCGIVRLDVPWSEHEASEQHQNAPELPPLTTEQMIDAVERLRGFQPLQGADDRLDALWEELFEAHVMVISTGYKAPAGARLEAAQAAVEAAIREAVPQGRGMAILTVEDLEAFARGEDREHFNTRVHPDANVRVFLQRSLLPKPAESTSEARAVVILTMDDLEWFARGTSTDHMANTSVRADANVEHFLRKYLAERPAEADLLALIDAERRPGDEWTPLPTSAEWAATRRALLRVTQERDHWKANHDNQVARNRELRAALSHQRNIQNALAAYQQALEV